MKNILHQEPGEIFTRCFICNTGINVLESELQKTDFYQRLCEQCESNNYGKVWKCPICYESSFWGFAKKHLEKHSVKQLIDFVYIRLAGEL